VLGKQKHSHKAPPGNPQILSDDQQYGADWASHHCCQKSRKLHNLNF